ncbi:transposase [Ktedonobacteria bacterium brp13]|nr:transposase [Ktedonobacteria bacterium brp13]
MYSERDATRRVLTQSDPQSRIMKSSTHAGFEQDYNAQVAVDQQSLLIVGCTLSNHPNDSQEAEPTLAAIPSKLGTPEAAALDAGYFGPATLAACAKRGIEPYIATGRDPHHPSWQQRFAPLPDPPPEDASAQVKMAYKLKTVLGKAIYGARKCTVEPVIGIIKEVLGFRQFSLRGTTRRLVSGVWSVWPSISNAFTPSPGRKAGNTGANTIRPPHDRPYSVSEEAPFSRFCPYQEELVCVGSAGMTAAPFSPTNC